ncbi:MAG: hypothetical protein ACTHMG_17245 [Sphingomonas sp.]
MTTHDLDLLERLQSPEPWPAADLALRGAGGMLLALCAVALWVLYRLVQRPPLHPATLAELAAAAGSVITWGCGWAALGEGKGLFRRVVAAGRHPHRPSPSRKTP